MSSTAIFPIIDGQFKMEKEPVVGIGVVLSEDRKAVIGMRIPSMGYAVVTDSGKEWPLEAGEHEIHAVGGQVTLIDKATGVAHGPSAIISILPPAGYKPTKAGDGILVRAIIAGRGFHWQKEHNQTLSHTLEWRANAGNLLLVNRIALEAYLTGVITGEMSGECPIEFMKAQAVAARSWLLGQPRPPHPGQPFVWCNDDCCQRYHGTGGWSERAVQAIRECRGQVLITPSDKYCDARYSKSTGGISEDATSVWGEVIEGLDAVVDAPAGSHIHRFFPITEDNLVEYITGDWVKETDAFASPNVAPESTLKRYLGRVDEVGEYFRWEKTLTQESLQESLRARAGLTDLGQVLDLIPGKRGRSGRLETLRVDYLDTIGAPKSVVINREYYIRAALSKTFLYSSAILIDVQKDATGVLKKAHLRGAGWGHGAGLCQIGGLGRALKGQAFPEILKHYYQGVRLEQIYP